MDVSWIIRKNIVSNKQIVGLLQNGRGIFGADFGSVTFVIKKTMPYTKGQYRKLYDNQDQAIVRTSDIIHRLFLDPTYGYYQADQSNFKKIPGCPIGFWITEEFSNKFRDYPKLKSEVDARVGMVSGDNNRFLRYWHEVSSLNIEHNAKPFADPNLRKWYPIQKGGDFRLWYGNLNYVVNWKNNGYEIMHDNFAGTRVRSHNYNGGQQFKEGITWNSITMSKFQCRYSPEGFTFDASGPLCEVTKKEHLYYILGFLSGKIARFIFSILNPTVNFPPGYLESLPLIYTSNELIEKQVQTNVYLSKSDWDAHETSWDFQRNELLSIDADTYMENINYEIEKHYEETGEHISLSPAAPKLGSLEWRMEQYKTKWERKFMQLHKNEEELNRQFIDIYGLQDELTPDVPLNEITILQQGEINVAENGITWNGDVMTKQLISYAVGCMLGRYRLDKPGLHIAHPNPTDEEIAPYEYKGEQWEIDDDGIMPLMPNDCGFSDNASTRFADFIRVALGNEEHVENLNYVEKCLGKTLEQYFVKDFWKDHKKMYQNRPIYWLFSSKKGAFQVIAYMHRMNAYTVERVRSKYLLPYIEHLEAEIDKLDARRAELSTKETKQLQALQKQLDECREYHERLQVVAEQAISFDLDDGVVVNYAKFGDILQKIK